MPGLRERITSALKAAVSPSPEPLRPASVVKGKRDEHAAGLSLDELCRCMRPRALAFARAFLSAPTATAAARRAGYGEGSIRATAVRLLRDPYVRRYIELARIEAAVAERANLTALRARLWDVSEGRPRADGSVPSAAERASARTNLTRILVALEGLDPGATRKTTEDTTIGQSGAGFTAEVASAFERDVLGVELEKERT